MNDAQRYCSPSDLSIRNHVAVLPCGSSPGHTVNRWTEDELRPYVHYLLDTGTAIDTMFQGFAFTAIAVRPDHFIHPLYAVLGTPAEQSDWSHWLEELFRPGIHLSALNTLAEREVDVWIGLPYPHRIQSQFGLVGDHVLDFEDENDRLAAVEWWIDHFLQRWQCTQDAHSNLHLCGFLWPRDTILPCEDAALVCQINARIHARLMLTMWLPNYGSYLVDQWRDLGFDVAAISPNFYGHTECPREWISYASKFAQDYATGMQIVFGKGLIFDETHHIDYFNLGLDEYNGYMKSSFLVYQFPNQRVSDIYRSNLPDYIRLYTFIKGLYSLIRYPGMPY